MKTTHSLITFIGAIALTLFVSACGYPPVVDVPGSSGSTSVKAPTNVAGQNDKQTAQEGLTNIGGDKQPAANDTNDTKEVSQPDVSEPATQTLTVTEYGFEVPYPAGYSVEKIVPLREELGQLDFYQLVNIPLVTYKITKDGDPSKFYRIDVYPRPSEDLTVESKLLYDHAVISEQIINTRGGLKGLIYETNALGWPADPKVVVLLPQYFVYVRSDFVMPGPRDDFPMPDKLLNLAKEVEAIETEN